MLLDSNVIIYSAKPENPELRKWITATAPFVSAVSYVEVLGFHRLSEADRKTFQQFFSASKILPLDGRILDQAITLRQQHRMTLGDALVAGTAIVHNLTLVTRNTDDFKWIPGFRLLDPFKDPLP